MSRSRLKKRKSRRTRTQSIGEYLASRRALIDRTLDEQLPPADTPPGVIHEAMRYAVLGGGKRIRPILAIAAAEACGADVQPLLTHFAALELIHTYSLVHDDLPALDNDELRRGRKTTHVVFGEAIGILTGDALLTEAFAWLAREPGSIRAIREVAEAVDSKGMIGGQVADLEATAPHPASGHPLPAARGEGLRGEARPEGQEIHEGARREGQEIHGEARREGHVSSPSPRVRGEGARSADEGQLAHLEFIHKNKTGKLLTASVLLGGILGGGSEQQIAALRHYGRATGLAFQIVDDLLDQEQTSAELGKTAGKDLAQGKLTYPALMGASAARERVASLLSEATENAARIGGPVNYLGDLARYICERRS